MNLHRGQENYISNYIVQKSICQEKIDHLEITVNSVIAHTLVW